MALVLLHPAACRRDLVAKIQKDTGRVALIKGSRVELVTPSHWTEQFCSRVVRSRIADYTGPGAA